MVELKSTLTIGLVTLINITQLLQALSFVKYAPKSGSWGQTSEDFFTLCKHLSLRYDDDIFNAFYILAVILCISFFTMYLIFSDSIHRLNKTKGLCNIFFSCFEYFIFDLGCIAMVSKFVEVQICNDSLNIDALTSVACFKDTQLIMIEFGYICIGIVYILNSVIFPTLKFERNSVDRLWGNESYAEGFYYIVLIGTVSLLGYIMLPWVGILLCGTAYLYMWVIDCFESTAIACSKSAVLASLTWAFACAYVLENDQSAADVMLLMLPVAYLLGYALRLVRKFVIKRDLNLVPLAKN